MNGVRHQFVALAKCGRRCHQLERRPRGIKSVTRAVQQRFGVRSGPVGPGIACAREQLAGVRIEHDGSGLSARSLRVFGDDGSRPKLEARVDRELNVARPIAKGHDRLIVRVVAMAQERDDRAIVALQSDAGLVRAGVRRDGRGMVVESAQRALRVALHVGGVRRAPVDAGPRIPEKMKGAAAKRIASLARVGTDVCERDVKLLGTRRAPLRSHPCRPWRAGGRGDRRWSRAGLRARRRARAGCRRSAGLRRPARRGGA